MLAFVGHPGSQSAGTVLHVSLRQETNESAYDWSVAFDGGLKLLSMPTMGVRGELVKGGVSWLELVTLEEWQPVPVLALPRLNGTCLFYPDGTVVIDVEARMDSWAIVPDVIEFRNVYASVAVAPFAPFGNFSAPDLLVCACDSPRVR